jgi:hypothetical protein
MIIVHLRKSVSKEELLRVAAQWTGQPVEEVLFDYIPRIRGFLTTFELYESGEELGFARRLAAEFQQDVLISPPAEAERDPFHWWLIDSAGDVHDAKQSGDDEDEDGIVLAAGPTEQPRSCNR